MPGAAVLRNSAPRHALTHAPAAPEGRLADAKKLALEVWQDPQGAVVLEWSDGYCRVYFECWEGAGVRAPYLAEVTFHHSLAVRGEVSEFPPYRTTGDAGPSYLLEVTDSDWLADLRARQKRAYGTRAVALKPDVRHLVIVGHDNHVEVLCTGYEVRRVSPETVPHVRFD